MARDTDIYKFDTPPMESDAINEQLRDALIGAGVTLREAPNAVRDIAAVGALITDEMTVREPDMTMVVSSAKMLADAGIAIHPAPRLRVFNLLAPVKSDFLQTGLAVGEKPNMDLATICYVPRFSARTNGVTRLKPEQLQMQSKGPQLYRDFGRYSVDRLCAVSNYQMDLRAWDVAAREHGAKFVVTFGGTQDEIRSDDFAAGRHFETLIDTTENFGKTSIGHSSGSYGVLVNKKHRAAFAESADQSHLIGRRLLSPADKRPAAQNVGTLRR